MRIVTPSLIIHADGREICRPTAAGRALYYERKRVAWEAQGRCCGICLQPMLLREATVDHIRPRGMGSGFRDDRMENIRAAHMICNSNRGSRRDYR